MPYLSTSGVVIRYEGVLYHIKRVHLYLTFTLLGSCKTAGILVSRVCTVQLVYVVIRLRESASQLVETESCDVQHICMILLRHSSAMSDIALLSVESTESSYEKNLNQVGPLLSVGNKILSCVQLLDNLGLVLVHNNPRILGLWVKISTPKTPGLNYHQDWLPCLFRSTSKSRPNNIRGETCPSVRPSVHKKFLRFQ